MPGFGLEHSYIVFPLDRKTALLGSWEDEEIVYVADRDRVAAINSHILASADRFAIYPSDDFAWRTKDGQNAGHAELAEWYRARPKTRQVEHSS